MKHTEIINSLIQKFGYKSYLEIGTQKRANNFDKIKCESKMCIDPDPHSDAILHLTSDEYFEKHINITFDVVFVDGLHESTQVHRDIVNSFLVLNPGGTIVVHDLLPTDEAMQRVPRETKIWTGNGWMAWVKCRRLNDDLEMFVIDTDYGCGILREGQQEILKIDQPQTYYEFEANKKEWMNIITVEQFNKWLKK